MIKIEKEKPFLILNVWLNELPDQAKAGKKSLSESIKSVGSDFFNMTKVAIEFRNSMHASGYGLLGFEYLQEVNADDLEIIVHYIDSPPFDKNHWKGYVPEKIIEGIDAEFAKAILNEAKEQFKAREIVPAGKFIFCVGKSSDVGSSIRRSQFLTKMLMDIFYTKEQINEQKLLQFRSSAEAYIKSLSK